MEIPANELGRCKSPSVRTTLFPEFRSFISEGKAIRDEVVDLLTEEEVVWLRTARTSLLHGAEVISPKSENTFPHLAGFTLVEKTQS